MKMSQFLFFKYVCMLKSSNIEGNTGRSASDLKPVDAEYSSC